MRRRAVIAGLGATLAAPAGVRAQTAKPARIGFLSPREAPTATARDPFLVAFAEGLRGFGWIESGNLTIEWRYAAGRYERLDALAAELVGLDLAAIATYGTAPARALQRATRTIPIVVAAAVDLVGSGMVESLARPGGNITGLSAINLDLTAKQLALLAALLPGLARVGVLVNPGNAAHAAVLDTLRADAMRQGMTITPVDADTPAALETAFTTLAGARTPAVIVAADGFFSGQGPLLARLSAEHRIATVGIYRDHPLAGCLMSYGPDIAAFHHQAARYVDKILKGAKPADLPVEQPATLELLINRKVAEALGLEIPAQLLARADRIIE